MIGGEEEQKNGADAGSSPTGRFLIVYLSSEASCHFLVHFLYSSELLGLSTQYLAGI
jgi:hypothetical protein